MEAERNWTLGTEFERMSGGVLPKVGTTVRVANREYDANVAAFFVKEKHIEARKPIGTKGTYRGYVPGAGGDVWWVLHEDNSVAAYAFTELEVELCA